MSWVVAVVQGLLIVAFLGAGGMGKLGKNSEMKEQFKHYGLSAGFMYFIGLAEVVGAIGLLAGYWVPVLAVLAAGGLALVMAGAVVTHLRVGDGIGKSMPALVLLVLSVLVIWGRLSLVA